MLCLTLEFELFWTETLESKIYNVNITNHFKIVLFFESWAMSKITFHISIKFNLMNFLFFLFHLFNYFIFYFKKVFILIMAIGKTISRTGRIFGI